MRPKLRSVVYENIQHGKVPSNPPTAGIRVVVSYKRKYVHELLVNRLFKPAQEKVWLRELTVPQ